eukprot:7299260-Lingulodinium_polyedra.AAC.1
MAERAKQVQQHIEAAAACVRTPSGRGDLASFVRACQGQINAMGAERRLKDKAKELEAAFQDSLVKAAR